MQLWHPHALLLPILHLTTLRQRFHWLWPWKTLAPTLRINGKQSSVRALTRPRVIVMFGPTERSLKPWVGVRRFLHLLPCGEAQVLFQKPQWKRSYWACAKSGVRLTARAESACFTHCGSKIHNIFPCLFKNYVILEGIIVRIAVLR